MNNVSIIGNLTRDVEVRYTPSGAAVGETCVAISEKYKDKNGQVIDRPVFVDITAWQAAAENMAKYLSKGDRIGITGKLSMDSWEDKQTGQKRSKLKVTVERFHFCGSSKNPKPQQHAVADDDGEQEIPF